MTSPAALWYPVGPPEVVAARETSPQRRSTTLGDADALGLDMTDLTPGKTVDALQAWAKEHRC